MREEGGKDGGMEGGEDMGEGGRGEEGGKGRPVLYLDGQRQHAFHLHILPVVVPHTCMSRPVLGNQSSG